jgi:hypothetical protein
MARYKAYVAKQYPYESFDGYTKLVEDRIVRLKATTHTKTYDYVDDGWNLILREVHVVDFFVETDNDEDTAEVWIKGYEAEFKPARGMTLYRTDGDIYKYKFIVPPDSDGPDYKWGVYDPDPFEVQDPPGWKLRVTVKRK